MMLTDMLQLEMLPGILQLKDFNFEGGFLIFSAVMGIEMQLEQGIDE